jgi:hypothetical protein
VVFDAVRLDEASTDALDEEDVSQDWFGAVDEWLVLANDGFEAKVGLTPPGRDFRVGQPRLDEG